MYRAGTHTLSGQEKGNEMCERHEGQRVHRKATCLGLTIPKGCTIRGDLIETYKILSGKENVCCEAPSVNSFKKRLHDYHKTWACLYTRARPEMR